MEITGKITGAIIGILAVSAFISMAYVLIRRLFLDPLLQQQARIQEELQRSREQQLEKDTQLTKALQQIQEELQGIRELLEGSTQDSGAEQE